MPGQISNFYKNFGKYIQPIIPEIVNTITDQPTEPGMSYSASQMATGLQEMVEMETDPSILAAGLRGIGTDLGTMAGDMVAPVMAGWSIYSNLNKLDDPNRSKFDKGLDIAKAAVAPLGIIPVLNLLPAAVDGVIDSASFLSDVANRKIELPGEAGKKAAHILYNFQESPQIGPGRGTFSIM
jgi:hypothetical protein